MVPEIDHKKWRLRPGRPGCLEKIEGYLAAVLVVGGPDHRCCPETSISGPG